MKKTVLIAALLSPSTLRKIICVSIIFNFQFLFFNPVRAQAVVSNGFDRLQVSYKTTAPEIQYVQLNRNYALLTLPGYSQGGEIGSPSLPVRCDVIEIPFCDNIKVSVTNTIYDTLDLSKFKNHSSKFTFYPLQPSRSKSDTTAIRSLVFDEKIYETDAFFGHPLAEVEVMGLARDRRLAQLRYSPVQVNPVTGQVIVCRSADVIVSYEGTDADRSFEHYRRYHTPSFSVGTTLNNLYSSNQTIKQSENQPIRMVIAVPNVLRCNAIERFANWKRRQGLLVDLLYHQDLGITTNTALANYFQSLYDTASDTYPAPTFLLLVGDHNQLPAFNSQISTSGYYDVDNDHITDLYFATWTSGDNLPDCYQGRFSATDTTTLDNIVNKTLLYEQYAFTDDSYLARGVLIAGEDNAMHTSSGWSADYAWTYADPTMDYIAYNYVNAAHGYNQVSYYKNDTAYAPSGVSVTGYCSNTSSASALRSLYNTGIGWINYSAHGDWDEWHKPSFKVSHVSTMSNNGKPSFMIGNCCLTNKFEKSTCFGEALLRKGNNAGAVAYIGGTNSTYWEQDLYWSVGIRSNIRHDMAPTYNADNLGVYDRLFHTHGEPVAEHVTTAGSIVYHGNLAVNASSYSPNMKKYYWEIYELMGDPSLVPWNGRATTLNVTVTDEGSSLDVVTEPHAYVALVDTSSFRLLFAGYTDGSGRLSIPLSDVSDIEGTMLSATLQGHKPYTRLFANDPLSIEEVESSKFKVEVFPNPAADQVTVRTASSQPLTVSLLDISGRTVSEFRIQKSEFKIDVSSLPSSLYLLRIHTPSNVITRKLIKK